MGHVGDSGKSRFAALGVAILVSIIGYGASSTRAEESARGRRADQEALKAYASLVGGWRGVGQAERGRAKGAWTESAGWAWKLSKETAALEVTFKKGKYLKSGLLRPGQEAGTFAFEATLADGSKRNFVGKPAGAGEIKPLLLTAEDKAPSDGVRRITMTLLHETRLLVLLEAENSDRHTFARIGEVGYTREGVSFAAGESYPLCIVTEGKGTIQVSHKGKSYWVCCSGCRDLFNENPGAVLAEAAEREKGKAKK